jgi:hypothetical protein
VAARLWHSRAWPWPLSLCVFAALGVDAATTGLAPVPVLFPGVDTWDFAAADDMSLRRDISDGHVHVAVAHCAPLHERLRATILGSGLLRPVGEDVVQVASPQTAAEVAGAAQAVCLACVPPPSCRQLGEGVWQV